MVLFVYVSVQDIDFPFSAIRIFDPEFILVGMAAINVHLFIRHQAGSFDTLQVIQDGLPVLDLDTHMMSRAPICFRSGMQREIQWRGERQEFGVPRFDLDWIFTKELRIKRDAALQVADGKGQMDFRVGRYDVLRLLIFVEISK